MNDGTAGARTSVGSSAAARTGVSGKASEPDSPQSSLSAAQVRDIRKKLQSLERKMNTAQRKVDEAKEALQGVDPYDYQALGEAQGKVNECEEKLAALEEEWLDTAALLEE